MPLAALRMAAPTGPSLLTTPMAQPTRRPYQPTHQKPWSGRSNSRSTEHPSPAAVPPSLPLRKTASLQRVTPLPTSLAPRFPILMATPSLASPSPPMPQPLHKVPGNTPPITATTGPASPPQAWLTPQPSISAAPPSCAFSQPPISMARRVRLQLG